MERALIALSTSVFILLCMLNATPAFSYEGLPVTVNSNFKEKQRAFALFAHEDHNERADIEECNVCHHVYQLGEKVEGESSEDMRCSDCHNIQKGYPTRPLMKAYHDLCKSCHQENRVGPITCGECHLPG